MMTEEHWNRIPILLLANKNVSALKSWIKLDTAFQQNKRDNLEIP
jgi:hypothetical protein